jgi:WhiB family redox-sensing transcriptional regulator
MTQSNETRRIVTEERWMEQAKCKTTPDVNFFPSQGQSAADAKAVCAECAVATACLDYALRNDERFGVWGGTSEKQRRALRRELGITVTIAEVDPAPKSICGTNTGYYRHRRKREKSCEPCLIAHRDYVKPIVAAWRERQRGDAA